jgi:hypothetical protein
MIYNPDDKRAITLNSLRVFLANKNSGAELSADCIIAFLECLGPDKVTRENLSLLRSELKDIRDGADFAIRQIKNL